MTAPLRLGIMGGTFDPIHIGHLVAASEARFRFDLDRILFIPAARPWQKSGYSDPEDRFLMTSFAATGSRSFSVSRVELDRHGPTYTSETLGFLKEHHGEVELFLILGADAAAGVPGWHQPERVFELAELIVPNRPGAPGLTADIPHHPLEMPVIEVSSTDIRNRVRSGRPIDFLVPDGVAEHIWSRGLYVGDESEVMDA
ncbi:MAG: nicotinate-nucleotide adenylyltransferase [Actinobacteria bacterium]|nr:nicotinate-nucleotide adenylyltransferase [Actinomycetota bacterium]